jgi:Flp pilus assembly protein TadD
VAVHTAGDTAEAARRYQAVLTADPTSPLAANNLASILSERGEQLDYAEQLATRALEQAPDAEIYDTLGSIQAKRSMFGAAAKNLERAVALQPQNADFHYRLGLAYLALSDPVRARHALDRAVRLNPRLAAARNTALITTPEP